MTTSSSKHALGKTALELQEETREQLATIERLAREHDSVRCEWRPPAGAPRLVADCYDRIPDGSVGTGVIVDPDTGDTLRLAATYRVYRDGTAVST